MTRRPAHGVRHCLVDRAARRPGSQPDRFRHHLHPSATISGARKANPKSPAHVRCSSCHGSVLRLAASPERPETLHDPSGFVLGQPEAARGIVAMPSASSRSPITDFSVRRPDSDERCQLGRSGLRHVRSDELRNLLDQARRPRVIILGHTSGLPQSCCASYLLAGWANADPAFPEAHSVRSLLPS